MKLREFLYLLLVITCTGTVVAWKLEQTLTVQPLCGRIHIHQTWPVSAPDGTTVGHFHAFLHERYDSLVYIQAAPQWPDALLCFFPPDSA